MSLAGISDERGRYAVLAIDHRDSMRAFLSPGDPDAISAEAITDLKIDLVRSVAGAATGVMLEPEYSIPQVLDAGVMPDGVGFLAALEAQGYLGDPGAAPTTILEGWSPQLAKDSGAACAKLLLPYHPDRELAPKQEAFAAKVLSECRSVGIPLVLEPLFYDLDSPADRTRVVLETAARFINLNPDLLKLPFPVDPAHDPDPDAWFAACQTITVLAHMPWALLSGGGTFEAFEAQLRVAMGAGCAGYMVGRALWGDAATAPATQRQAMLDGVVLDRMRRLRAIVDEA